MSRLFGATGVNVRPCTPLRRSPVAACAADTSSSGLITIAADAAAAPPSTERRLSACWMTSCMAVFPEVLGMGLAHALPQRKWQVARLREPWGPVALTSGRRRGDIG